MLTWKNTTSRAGEDAALPPLPERVSQHALDVLEGVARGDARRQAPAGFLGLDRDPAHDRRRRRGPPRLAALRLARRRQPLRPHGRRGHPEPPRGARRDRLDRDGLRVAPAARLRPHRLQGGLLLRRPVVPEDRRLPGVGLELPPVPRHQRVLRGLRQLRRLDRRAGALPGQGGRDRPPRRRARDVGRTRALPIPAARRPRFRVDRGPGIPRLRRHVPRGRPRGRPVDSPSAARARGAGRAALQGRESRALGLRARPRALPVRDAHDRGPAVGRQRRRRHGVPHSHHGGHRTGARRRPSRGPRASRSTRAATSSSTASWPRTSSRRPGSTRGSTPT